MCSSDLEENSVIVANTPEEFAGVLKNEAERALKVVAELRARGVRFE